jgi:hypothetical protein
MTPTEPEDPDATHRRLRERHQQGGELAATLVGLTREEAVDRIDAAGFFAQVITPDVDALTMDLRFERIRVHVDDDGTVTKASAG